MVQSRGALIILSSNGQRMLGEIISVPLRGGRDYVHSTDLFESLEELSNRNGGYISYIRFINKIKNKFELKAEAVGNFSAEIVISYGNSDERYFISEIDSPITEFHNKPEIVNNDNLYIDGNNITIEKYIYELSSFESIIFSAKEYLKSRFSEDYHVAQCTFLRQFDLKPPFDLILVSKIGKACRFRIMCDGVSFGHIDAIGQ